MLWMLNSVTVVNVTSLTNFILFYFVDVSSDVIYNDIQYQQLSFTSCCRRCQSYSLRSVCICSVLYVVGVSHILVLYIEYDC